MKTSLRVFLLLGLVIFLALGPSGWAQVATQDFQCFPTCSESGGRFLSLGGTGLQTTSGFKVTLGLTIAADRSSFQIGIFDGDTGRDEAGNFPPPPPPSTATFGHWDEGTDELIYELYADPLGDGSGSGGLVATWFGNSVNPGVPGVWSADAPEMPDNAWWNVTVQTSSAARVNPTDPFRYAMRIANPAPTAEVSSSFKLRTDGSMFVRSPGEAWGIQGAVRAAGGPTARIVYPQWNGNFTGLPSTFFLTTPSTYDGNWEFRFDVNPGQTTIRIFDGDFDHGTNLLTTTPSNMALPACSDDDDANFSGTPPFASVFSLPEGVNSPGDPPDDNRFDFFRRMPCVEYEVVDPNGVVYRNPNPSANREWELFVITTDPTADATVADYSPIVAADGTTFVVPDPNQGPPGFLTDGMWRLRLRGLDLANTVFLNGPDISGIPSASLGDRVWLDSDGDRVQDLEEPGLNGVILRLYRDDRDSLFSPNPNPGVAFGLDTFVDQQTTTGDGDYLFSPLGRDDLWVDVDESTLPPGAILTTANEPYTPGGPYPLMESENHRLADFGYRLPCSGTTCIASNFNGTAIPAGRTIWFNAVGKFNNIPTNVPVQIQLSAAIRNTDCSGTTGGSGVFSCDKPIDSLTMIWDGSPNNIRVNAWKGSVGSTLLANQAPVSRGQALTVSGYAGSPNDVIWELFDASTGVKFGESTFHLSCSDNDMDGPEDCGKREGDGKARTGFINDWLLEGMIDSRNTLSCSSPNGDGTPDTGLFGERLPNSLITFSPTASQATTVFNAAENRWETTVPSSLASKNIFISGFALPVGMALPGGIDPVSWSIVMLSDTDQVEMQWKWAAAVYTNFGAHGALQVKPIDGDKFNPYANSDHAGTPENFKNSVTGGARGGGGSNYTGSYSGTKTIAPCQDNPIPAASGQCGVCQGGVTALTLLYNGSASANVTVYDDSGVKADKVLYSQTTHPGQQFSIFARPGQSKFSSDISLYVDGAFQTKLHTSCSQPIGPNQRVGDFEIMAGVSKDNGEICPLNICEATASGIDFDGDKAVVRLTNLGDVNLTVERIMVQWPSPVGNLIEIKRGGDTIHKGSFAPPSADVSSGWEGNRDKRQIDYGHAEDLKLKFAHDTTLAGDSSISVEFDQGCTVTADYRAPFSGGNFSCAKPINSLTMIWAGSPATIRVKAWKGQVGSTLLADRIVNVGDELTVTGYAGSPNDVIWEIFDAATGTKIGNSTFHLSCSDSDMNGGEDCGKREGDGKGQSGFINDWILEGMVDTQTNLNCTAP